MAKKKKAPRIRGEQKEKYPHFRRFKQKEVTAGR